MYDLEVMDAMGWDGKGVGGGGGEMGGIVVYVYV